MKQPDNHHYNHKISIACLGLILFIILSTCALPGKMILEPIHKDMYMAKGVDSLPSKENRGFVSTAYAILTGEGWVVIDSLSRPELSEELIKRLGDISGKPVKYLILTSHTPRHYHGVSAFDPTKVQIIAHQNLNLYADSEAAGSALKLLKKKPDGLFSSVRLVKSHIQISDKPLSLKLGKRHFDIIFLNPAHSGSDIVIHMKKEKILFTGDLVMDRKVPFCGHPELDIPGWLRALQKLKSLKAKTILTGSGGPTDAFAISFTETYLKYLYSNVSGSLKQGYSLKEVLSSMRINPYQFLPMYQEYQGVNIKNLYKILKSAREKKADKSP